MKIFHRVLIGISVAAALARGAPAAGTSDEIMVLPRFVVTADLIVFSFDWHCKWPTQKSKITRVWFNNIPKGGMMEKAGIRHGDRLLNYDGVTLSEMTGEWMFERLNHPWKAGETHEFLIERGGKKLNVTIDVAAKKPPVTKKPEA